MSQNKNEYIPQRGDVVNISLNPQLGHEQAGHRPVLVISPKTYNGKTGLALVFPITTQEKGYPFEIKIPDGYPVKGVVLSDQLKSLDWQARNAEFRCTVPHDLVEEAVEMVNKLMRE